jgi:hypothetical protein
VTIKRSEAIDLNITIDQAFQFIVSCGVVVPAQQLQEHLRADEPSSAGGGEPLKLPDGDGPSASSDPAMPASGS